MITFGGTLATSGSQACFYPSFFPKMIKFLCLGIMKCTTSRGELYLGGALSEPADGAVLVFRSDDATAAKSFAKNDPYVLNGLISKWTVRPWTVVIGE